MSDASDTQPNRKDAPKDQSGLAQAAESAGQALFNDASSASGPRSSSSQGDKTQALTDHTHSQEAGISPTTKLFEESIKPGDKGLLRSNTAAGLQDIQISGIDKAGSKILGYSDKQVPPALDSVGKQSAGSAEGSAQAITSRRDYSSEYGIISDSNTKIADKFSNYLSSDGSPARVGRTPSEEIYKEQIKKDLQYSTEKPNWDSSLVAPSSKNIIETGRPAEIGSLKATVYDLQSQKLPSEQLTTYQKEFSKADLAPVTGYSPSFEKYKPTLDASGEAKAAIYNTVDKTYSSDWKADLKPGIPSDSNSQIKDIGKQVGYDSISQIGRNIDPNQGAARTMQDTPGAINKILADQGGGVLGTRQDTSLGAINQGAAADKINTAINQINPADRGGLSSDQRGGVPNPATSDQARPNGQSGDNRGNGPLNGDTQAHSNAPSAADTRPNASNSPASDSQRTLPQASPEQRNTSPQVEQQRPQQASEQPRPQQATEQARPQQATELPRPAQEQSKPQQATELPRLATPAEQPRSAVPQPEQPQPKNEPARTNEVRAQQLEQEQKAREEAARREASTHAAAGAANQNKIAEQSNPAAAAKQELATVAKELNRLSTEQVGAVSLKSLTPEAAGKNPANEQAKASSNETARAAEAGARSIAELSAKNAAEASNKSAALDSGKVTKVDATIPGAAQNNPVKDVLTGKVSASDTTATVNAAAGKPAALNAVDAANAGKPQIDGKSTSVNATGIRNDAANTAAGAKPGAINPAGIRADLPGAGTRSNAPGVIGAGKFTEIPAGKLIAGKALPGDAAGGKRFLTGVEIGLLLAAAGVAKSRFDAARGTREGGGLVMNNDGKIMSIKSGKDYVVGAFGEKGSQTLFALADGAKRFPSREITLSAVLAITGATKMRDLDTQAGLRSAEQTIRIVRTVGKMPEKKVEFQVPVIQGPNPEQESDGSEPEKKDKLDNQLLGLLPAAPALFRGRRKETEDEKEKDKETAETENSDDKNTPIPIPRFRRSYKIDLDESLTGIAEAELGDINLAWLIADLNSARLTEYEVDGKRVVEMRKGTKLELPLPHEVVEFYKTCDTIADPDNLVTIVVNTDVDRERLEETLNDVLGLRRKSP